MGFCITSDSYRKYTWLPNSFICKYMPSANGNYVKLYLHLQMVSQQTSPSGELSVTSLADCMECTENDILRALHYWQREGLIKLQEENGEIQALTLCECEPDPDSLRKPLMISQPSAVEEPDPSGSEISSHKKDAHPPGNFPVPDKQNYTPLQAEALMKDTDIDHAITSVEQILGEPVSPAHLQTILYFMCDVGFSPALLDTLYETAVHKGKKQTKYIEAIGINWAKKGIRTPEEAREESASFSGRYALVTNAFGIHRSLAPAEREIIDSWETYHFADCIIEEACKRTILKTGEPNLKYASQILKNWHQKQVISLEDIAKCDESHKRQKRNNTGSKKIVVSKNQFQNFPQRAYSQHDYNSLERQLLQSQRN